MTEGYFLLSPVIILVVGAFIILALGFTVKRVSILGYLSLILLTLSLLLTLDMMGLSWSSLMGLDLWNVDSPLIENFHMKVDELSMFFFLIFSVVGLMVVLASITTIAEQRNHPEYYALTLLSISGMMLIACATDLIVLYLAFEFASISMYGLVAFAKKDERSTEAALKFFLMGAVSSAIILFGISLIYGVSAMTPSGTGATTDLLQLQVILDVGLETFHPALLLAMILLLAGFGFKITMFPFHMWAPDVYEGSPSTITALIAAGSKKAGFAAYMKVFLVMLLLVRTDWTMIMGLLAIVTMTVGNVLAISQKNVKRLLAYSSIAQAGYILIGITVASLGSADAELGGYAVSGSLYHILTHSLMAGGAFIIFAGASHLGIGENISDYRGLWKRSPFLSLSLTLVLLSLAGIPPMVGFFSKFVLFSSAILAGDWFIWLAVAGVLNSAISVYYYFQIVKAMYVLEGEETERLTVPGPIFASIMISLVGMIIAAILVGPIFEFGVTAGSALFP
ncbi:MAG: NADH-quinone oxidoreductase subunit N [Thermoplasmata archaeon]